MTLEQIKAIETRYKQKGFVDSYHVAELLKIAYWAVEHGKPLADAVFDDDIDACDECGIRPVDVIAERALAAFPVGEK